MGLLLSFINLHASLIFFSLSCSSFKSNSFFEGISKLDVDLVGDLSVLLEDLYNRVDKKENKDWREKIKTYKDKEHIIGYDEFHPQNILSLVNKKLGKNFHT